MGNSNIALSYAPSMALDKDGTQLFILFHYHSLTQIYHLVKCMPAYL